MKKFKLFFACLLLASLSQTIIADHLSGSLQLTARMNGNNEVPAVTTTAQGLRLN